MMPQEKRLVFWHITLLSFFWFSLDSSPNLTLIFFMNVKKICKSLGPSAVKHVVNNFTPDEFLPDPVPNGVLEELNREVIYYLVNF